jgi:hypothetical protein
MSYPPDDLLNPGYGVRRVADGLVRLVARQSDGSWRDAGDFDLNGLLAEISRLGVVPNSNGRRALRRLDERRIPVAGYLDVG